MEKERYIFNTQPKRLSDQEIQNHMDFDALLEAHNASNNSSPRRTVRLLYWLAPAAAAAILALIFVPQIIQQNDYPQIEQAYFSEQELITPPIPNALAKFASNKVDASNGGIYTHDSGSKVIIPKSAFVSNDGEVIGGEVEILYREYHDFVDFFLSGIPMHYDSLNQRYQLESAGMVEFYAEQNGKRVNVAPGKSIAIELASTVSVDGKNPDRIPAFNIYRMDKNERNWNYEGENKMEFADKWTNPANDIASKKRELQALEAAELRALNDKYSLPAAPIAPREANSEDFVFDLSFNDMAINYDGDLQELKDQYEGSLWQVSKESTDFDPALAGGIAWEDMKLEKLNTQLFLLTLYSGQKAISVKVHPVLTGAKFEQEQNKYREALADYNSKLANLEEAQADERKAIAKKYNDKLVALDHVSKEEVLSSIQRKVISRFTANRFGIWNVDRPVDPHPIQVHGKFAVNQTEDISNEVAYIADSERNTLSRVVTTQRSPVAFKKGAKTFMWVVTEDNKIAVFRPENFDQIKNDDDSYTFILKKSDKTIESESELRTILSL